MMLAGGCFPAGRGQSDEEKEPHFIAGKSRVNAMDFKGAVESFEKALEANPRSAAAHFELGWLFDQRQPDPSAAIFHYERYLRLNPKASNGDLVRQRILACKQELARTVSLGPVSEKQQRALEEMADENKRCAEKAKALEEEVTKWRIYFAAHGGAASGGATSAPPVRPGGSSLGSGGTGPAVAGTVPPGASGTNKSNAVATRRTHTLRQGETLSMVSRQYGVRLERLQAANPGLDPRRLRPGTVINIP